MEKTQVNEYKGGEETLGRFTVKNGTALHWAVYFEQPEVVTLLLHEKAGIQTVLLGCYLLHHARQVLVILVQ